MLFAFGIFKNYVRFVKPIKFSIIPALVEVTSSIILEVMIQ